MCPWPRLQGAIWDPEAYHGQLPRLSRRTAHVGEEGRRSCAAAASRPATASTAICASTVCPIGIDIREGPNFACINCGLCVDACDGVMTKLQRPRGLIDYESWNNIERGRASEARVVRLIRPKTIGLPRACMALAAGMALLFANRTTGSISVAARPQPGRGDAVGRLGPQCLYRKAAEQIRRAARISATGRRDRTRP